MHKIPGFLINFLTSVWFFLVKIGRKLWRIIFRVEKKNFKSKLVLVTGGAQGIGKAIVRQYLQEGSNVVIWDYNKDALEETLRELKNENRGKKVGIQGYVVDVSDWKAVEQAAARVQEEIGVVTVLVLNAGVFISTINKEWKNIEKKHYQSLPGNCSLGGPDYLLPRTERLDIDDDTFRRINEINYLSHFKLMKMFLPGMIDKNDGHIISICSSTGVAATGMCPLYSATKFAAFGLAESVGDMMRRKKYKVDVTIICPQLVDTNLITRMRSNFEKSGIPLLSPIQTAKTILAAAKWKRKVVTVPERFAYYVYFCRLFNMHQSVY